MNTAGTPQRGDTTVPLPDDDEGAALGGTVVMPDGTTVQLSAEDAQKIADAKEAEDEKRMGLIQNLITDLVNKRESVVRARRDIERRWIDDQRQWDGENRLMDTKEFPSQSNTGQNLTPPRPHLTRSRCDLWEARGIDLLVPTDDPTWELRALTVEDVGPPPNMDLPTWQGHLQDIKDEMQGRADKMCDVIKDQLRACNATKSLRHMIIQAFRLGAGLVMGPMNGIHIRRKYDPSDPQNPVKVAVEETVLPEIREGDIWNFYPDMTSSAERAEYAFYLHSMSETELWAFADFPGVNREEVMELMKEKPTYGEVEVTMRERNQYSGLKESIDNRHAVWRYTGIVDREYCEALGIEAEEGPVCADIWFSNNHILKSKLTMLSTVKDFRIPYYVFAPFPIDDTMFGASVAYLCRDSQRTADSAWIMGLHNLSVSAGPQIVLAKGMVTPADGKYDIRGPKVWYKKDDAIQLPAQQIFDAIMIPNNAEQAGEWFERSKQLMDEELNTTQWASPDTSEVTETASGLAMLMNARTILQRRVCACADDEIFSPMIQRFVLWNMLYNQREDIKGDFDVRPLCQSVRLVKDIQIQQKLFVAKEIVPLNPGLFDTYAMWSDILRDMDAHVTNWLVPKQQWQQAQQAQQQDPRSQLAQSQIVLNQAKAGTEQAKQHDIANDILMKSQAPDSGATNPGADAATLHMHAIDNATELQRVNSQLGMKQMDVQTKMATAAMKQQGEQDRLAANLRIAAERNRHDLIKTGMNNHTKVVGAQISKAAPPGGKIARPAGKFTPPKVPTFHRGKG